MDLPSISLSRHGANQACKSHIWIPLKFHHWSSLRDTKHCTSCIVSTVHLGDCSHKTPHTSCIRNLPLLQNRIFWSSCRFLLVFFAWVQPDIVPCSFFPSHCSGLRLDTSFDICSLLFLSGCCLLFVSGCVFFLSSSCCLYRKLVTTSAPSVLRFLCLTNLLLGSGDICCMTANAFASKCPLKSTPAISDTPSVWSTETLADTMTHPY